MAEPKGPEHDTTPQTPHSKRTIAVRTGTSDPPPPLDGVAAVRPAAGSPRPKGGGTTARGATTLPRAVKARPAPAQSASTLWLGAAVFLLVVGVILFLTLQRPMP